MSINIGTQEFKSFIADKLGLGTSINVYEANNLGINQQEFAEEADGSPEIELDDILNGSGSISDKLAEMFKDYKNTEAKGEEAKKEEADQQRTTSGGGGKA